MTPTHHPSPAVLEAYALGELRSAFIIAAGVHVRACRKCQTQVSAHEKRAGAALLDHPAAPLAPDSFAETMSRVAAPPIQGPNGDGAITFGRRRWAAPGLWVRHASHAVRGADHLFLLKAPPRLGIPHGHRGLEFTTVLRGAIKDGDDYHAGDFAEVTDVAHHRPTAGPDGCLCLIAAEHRMRMHGLHGRLAQILTGA